MDRGSPAPKSLYRSITCGASAAVCEEEFIDLGKPAADTDLAVSDQQENRDFLLIAET